jgi:hypothetical protein
MAHPTGRSTSRVPLFEQNGVGCAHDVAATMIPPGGHSPNFYIGHLVSREGAMEFFLLLLLYAALVFGLIAVHESGHFLAGLLAGIPARDMRLVLFTFPQHVAIRDGDRWLSPVREIEQYIAVTRRHLRSRTAAFCWVAGGMAVELAFTSLLWAGAMAAGYRDLAFWAGAISLGMYAINVGLMDLPWAVRYGTAAGDTSGLWQIAPMPAVAFSIAMVAARLLLTIASTWP